MKSNFKAKMNHQIQTAKARIEACEAMNILFGVECDDVILSERVVDRVIVYGKEKSTPELLEAIIQKFSIVEIEVNTSSVIGTYLTITASEIVVRMIGSNLLAFVDNVIEEGKWVKDLNRKEPLGTWDFIRYQGGERKFFPQTSYSKLELIEQLTPLFTHFTDG